MAATNRTAADLAGVSRAAATAELQPLFQQFAKETKPFLEAIQAGT
jgi:hypothetical protein